MSTQRYVSSDLVHFAARHLRQDEDEQCGRFLDIIRGGILTKPGYENAPTVRVNRQARLSENEMYSPQVVCFCDIPTGDLGIHMSKYGRFGLSFTKAFLVPKGARPVFYIPRDARTYGELGHKMEGAPAAASDLIAWDRSMKEFLDQCLTPTLVRCLDDPETFMMLNGHGCGYDFLCLFNYLEQQFLAFAKCFDHSLPEDDDENFYMEREWRVLGNVSFRLSDVRRVILPEQYVERLRKELPDYMGQIQFADDVKVGRVPDSAVESEPGIDCSCAGQ